jgi:hypothetical protein
MYHIYGINLNQMKNIYLNKYNKGSDEFYFKEIEYKTYDKICPSIKRLYLRKTKRL